MQLIAERNTYSIKDSDRYDKTPTKAAVGGRKLEFYCQRSIPVDTDLNLAFVVTGHCSVLVDVPLQVREFPGLKPTR